MKPAKCTTPQLSGTPNLVGFLPIERADAQTLVLGSFPGVRSLDEREYYAQPRNAFWRVMSDLFGVDSSAPYDARAEQLKRHRVALWDVLTSCERDGSLDSAIVGSTAVPNELPGFLVSHARIDRVFFNGRKAAELYRRFISGQLGSAFRLIRYQTLPSTSPAYAGMPYAEKLAQWSVVREEAGANGAI